MSRKILFSVTICLTFLFVAISAKSHRFKRQGSENDIHFLLYTGDNPETPDELFVDDSNALHSSHFIRQGPLKILVHGYQGKIKQDFPWQTFQELMRLDSRQNVILVDWSVLAAGHYLVAKENAQIASRLTANLIDFLVREGVVRREDIHLIGFSLGGQVVGQIGSRVSEKLTRITALDPAFPFFGPAALTDRIDPSDALFVDVIHSNGGKLGFLDPVGTVDFYPNGGEVQPGCPDDGCSHERSIYLFHESIRSSGGFTGRKCPSWQEFQNGNCGSNEQAQMGYYAPLSATGSFFLATNDKPPYAQG